MRCSVEGIMYPLNAKAEISSALSPFSGHHYDFSYIEVPHKEWSRCKDKLDSLLLPLRGLDFPYVFVLGPLHKGPVTFDDKYPVYVPEGDDLNDLVQKGIEKFKETQFLVPGDTVVISGNQKGKDDKNAYRVSYVMKVK